MDGFLGSLMVCDRPRYARGPRADDRAGARARAVEEDGRPLDVSSMARTTHDLGDTA